MWRECLNNNRFFSELLQEVDFLFIVIFMDKLAFRNVRGFNQPLKRKEVAHLIVENQLGFCALIETHVAKSRVNNIFNKMFRGWDWFSNSEFCLKGCRIVVGWNPDYYDVLEIISTDQVIYCVVTNLDSKDSFHCSIVYAANDHVKRRELWHSLQAYSLLTPTSPWIIMGDFNAMLGESEILGGVGSGTTAMQEFKNCVNFIEVQDMVYSGIQYTWSGASQGIGVVKKLDRVLANLHFFQKFQVASARFLPRGVSDHSPTIVELIQNKRRNKSSFKFNNFLGFKENFLELVSRAWEKKNWRC